MRSFMNWDAISSDKNTKDVLNHWQKLGQFRANHTAVGAGKHQLISDESGLVFSRVRNDDKIVVGINLSKGNKELNVASIFENGQKLQDFYSNQRVEVKDGKVSVDSEFDIVLLEKI